MDIKILELEDTEARILFSGEGHTYLNALVNELLNDPDVDVARYNMKFPDSDPELYVSTVGKKSPIAVIIAAAQRIAASCDDLLSHLESTGT